MSAMASAASNFRPAPLTPGYALHPYQRQVLRDLLVALRSPERRAIAHLPTGAGKTRIAAHAACHLLNEHDDDGALLVWLAATEELCEQAGEQLTEAWLHLGRREAWIHKHWGSHQLNLSRPESGFLVTSLAKLRSAADRDHVLLPHLAPRVAGVVFDEAHQAVAKTYSHITEQLCSRRPPLIGLTATPGRTANFDAGDFKLAEMFRHTKVSIDPQGHGNPVTYLIKNGYLSDPTIERITFESERVVRPLSTETDYSDNVLKELGEDEDRNRKIVTLALKAAWRHARTLVFCPSVDSAHQCCDAARREGITADVVTTRTHENDRAAVILAFKGDDRERRVLFNFGVFTTGFDAPSISCVIIARPTTSLVLYSQMLGRAMRGRRAGGTRYATILTVVDTSLPGFGSVTETFANWEDLWTQN